MNEMKGKKGVNENTKEKESARRKEKGRRKGEGRGVSLHLKLN